MVIIFSEESDKSTSNVIDWLIKFQVPYIRLNMENVVMVEKICIGIDNKVSIILEINDILLEIENINAFWYRRGAISLFTPTNNQSVAFQNLFNQYLNNEKRIVEDFIFSIIQEKRGIGNFYKRTVNKLNVLHEAIKCGIKIPETYLSNYDALAENIIENKTLITKAISESVHLYNSQCGSIMNYTGGIKTEYIVKDNHRANYLIQEKIDKLFEIRSFYLEGSFYSMAMFSQENDKTKDDFRNYDFSNPIRTVPYKLPLELEIKLRNLMNVLSLNTGSIDIAYNSKKEYIFFEVNPVGQYGMVSNPCNYNLDKEIAESLKIKNCI